MLPALFLCAVVTYYITEGTLRSSGIPLEDILKERFLNEYYSDISRPTKPFGVQERFLETA